MDKVEHSHQHRRDQAFDRGYLPVSDGHTLYYEQAGNPEGVPVVCLHGGPGAGSNTWTRRFFDLDHFRIIQFDQRGAGKSTLLTAMAPCRGSRTSRAMTTSGRPNLARRRTPDSAHAYKDAKGW